VDEKLSAEIRRVEETLSADFVRIESNVDVRLVAMDRGWNRSGGNSWQRFALPAEVFILFHCLALANGVP